MTTEKLNLSELLTEKQVEQQYKINSRTLQRERVLDIGLPYIKLGRRIRYQRASIEQYLKDYTRGGQRYDDCV